MPQTADIKTWAIQAEDAPAHVARLLATALLREGVISKSTGSFQVTQDTGANMQISVGSGAVGDVVAIGGEGAGQGVYMLEHQAATQLLSIAASDPTNDRIDRVIARVYDDEADSSGNDYGDVEVVQGTPAGSPSAPALPGGAISLATILVQNGVTAITNSDITDLRVEAGLRSGLSIQDPFIVTRRAVVTSPVVINTTPTNIIAVTIPIPSHWAGYDVEAMVSAQILDTSGGATSSGVVITGQMVHQAGNFNTDLSWELMDLNYHDIHPFSQVSYVEGLTVTGNRAFTWQLTRAATFAASADQITLICRAIRTA